MNYEDISVSVAAKVATVTVCRPDKLNCLRDRTADELVDAFRALEADGEARAIVLTGEGRAFGAGYDLSTLSSAEDLRLERVLDEHFNPLIRTMRGLRLPIVAAVNGPCAGVSVGIALAADIPIAGRSAYFYEPFVGLALVPDGGNTLFLPSLAGRVRAGAAVLLGDRIPAADALAWGLVWQVVDDGELMARAIEIASRLAGKSPEALAQSKRLVGAASEAGLSAQLDLERDIQGVLGRSPEVVAAVERFLAQAKSG